MRVRWGGPACAMTPVMTQTITKQEVNDLLGEVADLDAARLIATGASVDELTEAVREVQIEDQMGEVAPPPGSGRVTALRAILEEILSPELAPADEERH